MVLVLRFQVSGFGCQEIMLVILLLMKGDGDVVNS